MLGTVPADMVQNFAHMIRVAQKLAYLYSWPDLFSSDGDEMDDATKGVLTLFIGVMLARRRQTTVSRRSLIWWPVRFSEAAAAGAYQGRCLPSREDGRSSPWC